MLLILVPHGSALLTSVRCSAGLQGFVLQLPGVGDPDSLSSRWEAQVQRAAAMSGDLTKPEDVVPFIVFLATDGALPSFSAVGAPGHFC